MIRSMTFAAMMLAAGVANAQTSTWRFSCPEAGTTVERTAGETITFRGSDPNDPFVCRVGNGQRLVLGVWTPGDRLYQNGRAQLSSLLSGAASGERRFDYFGVNLFGLSTHVLETWRLAGFQPIQVPAGTFDAVRLERQFEIIGTSYTYLQTVWLDRATNAPVKVEVSHLNAIMAPTLFSWNATELRSPAQRRPTS